VSIEEVSLPIRLANVAVAYVSYLGKMLWPINLAFFYPYLLQEGWKVVGALVILAALTIAVLTLARRRPYLAVGWFWYLGTLVPVIGLVQVGGQSMADRYTYVPLVGVFIAVAWGVGDLAAGWRYRAKVLVPVAAGVVLACVVATNLQARHWANSETLFEHALQVTTNNEVAHNNLGVVLDRQGRTEEAIAHYREALRIKPGYPELLNNLAVALAGQGKTEEAIAYCQKALRINSKDARAHQNLALVFSKEGRFEEATAHCLAMLRINSNDAGAHNNLGVILDAEQKKAEAEQEFREALRLDPDSAEIQYNLGALLSQQGKESEAAQHLREALRLRPDHAGAHKNLGLILQHQGWIEEAVSHYSEAVRLRRDDAEVRNNLAWIRATHPDAALRDGVEAVRLAERACELTGRKDPGILDTLAAAYAEAGRFADAAATASEAAALARTAGREDLARQIEAHQRLFEAGQPYRAAP